MPAPAVIAVLASMVALWLAFTIRAGNSWVAHLKKAGAAVVMGLAIIVMHYTGMEAARFDAASFRTSTGGLDGNWLALLVGVAAVPLLAMVLLLSADDSRLPTVPRAWSARCGAPTTSSLRRP